MDQLSNKELEILRYIRKQRHKTTVAEIARELHLPESEVLVFVQGMLHRRLLKVVHGEAHSDDGYYTNPEFREKIFELLG